MKRYVLLLSLASLVFVGSAMATPSLNDAASWNSGNASWAVAMDPYNASPGSVTLVPPGGTTATLRFNATPGMINPQGDLWAAGNYYGNASDYTQIAPGHVDQLSVTFKLESPTGIPSQNFGDLALFFQASNGNRWYHDLQPPSTTASTEYYRVNVGTDNGWYMPSDPLATSYLLDLASVDMFGFMIMGNASSQNQRYNFSDVEFQVPEPETIWMILMVLGSLAVVFRSRMGEMLAQLRARVRI